MTISFDKDTLARVEKAIIGVSGLTIGGLIYIRYRSESLKMFDWFHALGLTDYIEVLRKNIEMHQVHGWVKYNMPAGLWLFAYMLIIEAIWGKNKNNVSLYFLYVLPLLAIISELMQYIGIHPGTFDFMDLLSYFFSFILFILVKKVCI